jgi:hypothetical protein
MQVLLLSEDASQEQYLQQLLARSDVTRDIDGDVR